MAGDTTTRTMDGDIQTLDGIHLIMVTTILDGILLTTVGVMVDSGMDLTISDGIQCTMA